MGGERKEDFQISGKRESTQLWKQAGSWVQMQPFYLWPVDKLYHSLSAYYMLNNPQAVFHLIPTKDLQSDPYYYLHLQIETEAQRGAATCPKSPSSQQTNQIWSPDYLGCTF